MALLFWCPLCRIGGTADGSLPSLSLDVQTVEGSGEGTLTEPLHPHKSFADDFSDGLNLIMPPAVASISKCPGAAAEDVLQVSSLGTQRACWCHGPMCAGLMGLEAHHILPVLPSCCFILTALTVLVSSTAALTSSWTRQCPSFPLLFIWGVGKEASPALPRVITPTMLLWRILASTSWTVTSALHFLPVLTWVPALATFGSCESLYCSTSLALVTLNSFSKDLKGVWVCSGSLVFKPSPEVATYPPL